MSRYRGPKRRLSRREGVPLFQSDAKSMERKGAIPPGAHGVRVSRRRVSAYGEQLRAKQRAKRLYGLTEKQFKNTFTKASKKSKATGQTMLELLETRLDNVVYRLGFSRSRPEARQIVNHGHVTVDGKKVTIPSFTVKINSVVAIASKFVDNTQVKKSLEDSEGLPKWLDRKAASGKVLNLPERDDTEKIVDEQLIVEYYSR